VPLCTHFYVCKVAYLQTFVEKIGYRFMSWILWVLF